MTIEPPAPGEPRRPHGPRDPGDAWVIAPSGERYWGRFGAAGLLACDADRGILLQLRVGWSHFGNTWGLPGGARHQHESAHDGALREAAEEAGVPAPAIRARFESVLDLGVWTYTTLVGDVVTPFDPVIGDPESNALEWVPIDEVDDRALHPGFAAAWPHLRDGLTARPVIVVDMANLVGSVPNGWWRDRAGAASRMLGRLAGLASTGIPAESMGLPGTTWYPRIVAVLEGAASRAADAVTDADGVTVVVAEGEGDDTIATEAARLAAEGARVSVVTSDRGLSDRVTAVGAAVHGTRWLLDLLPEGDASV